MQYSYNIGETDYKIAQELPPITTDDLKRGFMIGDVVLANISYADAETVCLIGGVGGNWFYFGGIDAEVESPFKYATYHDFDEIISEIADVLAEFKEEDPTEWLFYYYTLNHK